MKIEERDAILALAEQSADQLLPYGYREALFDILEAAGLPGEAATSIEFCARIARLISIRGLKVSVTIPPKDSQ